MHNLYSDQIGISGMPIAWDSYRSFVGNLPNVYLYWNTRPQFFCYAAAWELVSIQFLSNSHALPFLFPPTPFLGFDQLLHFTPEANILAATCVREHTGVVPLCLAFFLKRNVFQFKDCLDIHVYACICVPGRQMWGGAGTRSFAEEVTGGCERPKVDTGNSTRVIWESSKCS